MKTVFEYYQMNPNDSIKDYIEYVNNCKKEEQCKEEERFKNCNEWYKALEGRCFLISFHSNAHIVLKVTKWPNTEFKNQYLCYNIYYNPNSISKENRDVNRYWFKNPYEKPYHGQDEGSCREISEESYNEIVEKCSKIEEITKSVDIKNL
jgi:hypothetical protein